MERQETVYAGTGGWPAGYRSLRFLGRGPHGVTVGALSPDGSPVVLKRLPGMAGTGAADALRHVAGLLAGEKDFLAPTLVVELATAVVTVRQAAAACLGGPVGGTEPAITVSGAASLIRGLSALHRLGLCHGSVRPGNVVFVGGRPVLTDAGLAALSGGRWEILGAPDRSPAWRMATASDVRDLAGLLLAQLEGDAADGLRPGLGEIACAPLRRLAAGGAGALTSLLEAGGGRRARRAVLPSRRPGMAAVGLGAGAVVVGAGAHWWTPARSTPAPTGGVMAAVPHHCTHPPPVVGWSASTLEAEVSPGTCPVRLVTSGPNVSVEGPDGRTHRFTLGSPGDVALVGDWFCRGVVLPADFRPVTGTVFEFPSWPVPGASVASSRVVTTGVEGGKPRVVRAGGCDRVVVTP